METMKRSLNLLIVLFLSISWLHAKESVVIGVLAKRGVDITLERWSKTATYLNQKLPNYHFRIAPLTFNQIQTAVQHKDVDFLIVNSAFYIDLEMNHGAQRIATLKNHYECESCQTLFGGVIFTRHDRLDITSLHTLKYKHFAAVDPQSFGGWIAAQYEMHQSGIDPRYTFQKLSFKGTHDAVVYAVLNGEVDAGTVRTETLENMAKEEKIDLSMLKVINSKAANDPKRLLSTRLYPEWPFAKLPHVKNTLAEKVSSALLQMESKDPAALTASISGWTIPQNYRPIHECLQSLFLGPYTHYNEITLMDVISRYWYLLGVLISISIVLLVITLHIRSLNVRLHYRKNEVDRLNTLLQDDIERQQSILHSVINSIEGLIFYKDDSLRYLGCNKAFEVFVGCSAKEIIGKRDHDLFSAEEADHLRAMDRRILRLHTPVSSEEWSCYPDGRRLFLQSHKAPLYNRQGMLLGIVGISIDHTHEYELRNALEDREQKLLEAQHIAHMGHWKYYLKSQHFEWSDEMFRIFGVNAHKVLPTYENFLKSIHPEDRREFKKAAIKTIKQHLPHNLTHRIIRPDGEVRYIHEQAQVHYNDEGQPLEVMGIAHDITELKQTEQELEAYKTHLEKLVEREIEERREQEQLLIQQSKMASMGEMIGNIAHQWRQPLNTLAIHIQDLKDAYEFNELNGEYLDKRVQSTMSIIQKMSTTIDDFRNFFRSDKTLTHFTVKEIIDETMGILGASLKNNGIKVSIVTECDETIEGYSGEYSQALINILNNAKDALKESAMRDAHIHLETHCEQGFSILTIRDNAGGIPPEIMDKIFDPYFTTKPQSEGTGIGLYMSKMIVERNMFGELSVKNCNEGACFTIRIPLHPEH